MLVLHNVDFGVTRTGFMVQVFFINDMITICDLQCQSGWENDWLGSLNSFCFRHIEGLVELEGLKPQTT